MSEDLMQDPEFIRGYEEAKQRIEKDRSPYYQGWSAAYEEEREKEREACEKEAKSFVTVAVAEESSHFRKETTAIMKDLLEHNRQILEEIKQLDERLKKLERYTEE